MLLCTVNGSCTMENSRHRDHCYHCCSYCAATALLLLPCCCCCCCQRCCRVNSGVIWNLLAIALCAQQRARSHKGGSPLRAVAAHSASSISTAPAAPSSCAMLSRSSIDGDKNRLLELPPSSRYLSHSGASSACASHALLPIPPERSLKQQHHCAHRCKASFTCSARVF
jgi:hypothetical protein